MAHQQPTILLCVLLAMTFGGHLLVNGEESQVSGLTYRNLQKAVTNFKTVLVKFDESYPSKSELDKQYKQTAQDFRFTSDVLITEVKVPYRSSEAKDSEVSEDRLFAEKLNAAKTEDLPVVYLFKQGQLDSPVRLEEKSFSADSLRQFVRSQVPSVRVLLESCVASLDELAANFVDPQKAGQRKALLKDAQAKVELLKADQKQSGKVYLKLMEKVIERGDMFLQSERERIKNLLAGQMSDVKKKQLQTRLNILESFQAGSASKDEL